MPIDLLLNNDSKYIQLTDEEKAIFPPVIFNRKALAEQFLLNEGEICNIRHL